MKKTLLVIIIFLLFIGTSGIAGAQSQNMEKVHSGINQALMNDNLAKLSSLLSKMSEMLAKGDVKSEHQEKCAEILLDVSSIMTEMAKSDSPAAYKQHQQKIEQVEKNGITLRNRNNTSSSE